ncbi:FAD-dependent monooxygenase [Tsukamurella sp. 8F]|uniref:FAD-dependent monooxygenase n=1 Tax=unclassified Tsukamurella TaxID=2633480 RepID=UPI0023B980A8|nr:MULTISPECIES: FAD-dependent monooxygenase [unclassified Tsukamurella]MDF0531211.1 FAD-dependent monooxygenase [Tsukamurella sp. 8J]MDF0588480.1 FAD-dependent monooxygenase [Tsukamurella sp. 8F]
MSRTVAIIGGGPAGLAAARLIKVNDPRALVTIYERADASGETFGFGVGLTESTMSNMAKADPITADRLREASHAGHSLVLRTGGREVGLHGARNLAIGRAALLEVLTKSALEAGVEIRLGCKAGVADVQADVVVAADGARSAVRERLAHRLGVSITYGSLHYMWCGTDFAVSNANFTWRTRDDAMFVVHAYPYADDRSTFLIETDDESFRAAGLDRFAAEAPAGESDERSLALLEDVFSEELGGRRLLANRTRWAQFPTVSLRNWSAGNVVLIGDAAHTAHYTIGSGTKLALEDAIALAEALAEHDDTDAAFAAYETARRPYVDRFKHLAARSQNWWSSFRERAAQAPERIALSYMTRAGNLGIEHYAAEYPETARAALAPLGEAPVGEPDTVGDWVLGRAPDVATADLAGALRAEWDGGEVWGPAHDAFVARLSGEDADVIVVGGPSDPKHVGARIDVAERVRWAGKTVVVEVPSALRTEAAAAVGAGRADAVVLVG